MFQRGVPRVIGFKRIYSSTQTDLETEKARKTSDTKTFRA